MSWSSFSFLSFSFCFCFEFTLHFSSFFIFCNLRISPTQSLSVGLVLCCPSQSSLCRLGQVRAFFGSRSLIRTGTEEHWVDSPKLAYCQTNYGASHFLEGWGSIFCCLRNFLYWRGPVICLVKARDEWTGGCDLQSTNEGPLSSGQFASYRQGIKTRTRSWTRLVLGWVGSGLT